MDAPLLVQEQAKLTYAAIPVPFAFLIASTQRIGISRYRPKAVFQIEYDWNTWFPAKRPGREDAGRLSWTSSATSASACASTSGRTGWCWSRTRMARDRPAISVSARADRPRRGLSGRLWGKLPRSRKTGAAVPAPAGPFAAVPADRPAPHVSVSRLFRRGSVCYAVRVSDRNRQIEAVPDDGRRRGFTGIAGTALPGFCLGLSALVSASHGETDYLTKPAIEAIAPCRFTGVNLRNGAPIRGEIRTNGIIRVIQDTPNAIAPSRWQGKWWATDDHKFCRFFGPYRDCQRVTKQGSTYTLYNRAGRARSRLTCR